MLLRRAVRSACLLGSMLSTAPAWAADTGATDSAEDAAAIVVKGQIPHTIVAAGTKSAVPILETPQSISVIESGEIARLGLQNLNQTLRYVAGVTPETRGASAEIYDQFKLRGFDAPIYLDGLKQFQSASGYAAPQIDLSRLDRIEVVKGPASVLYGQSSPGGLVAESSKLPLDQTFYGAVSGTYGNYDLYRVDADAGGRLGQGLLWRVYGSANGAHDQQTFGTRRRQTGSAAVTAGAGSTTSFTVLAAYSHDPRNGDYGVFPALGTLYKSPAGQIPTSFYGGEPGDFFKREQFGLTYIFRHDFGDGWAFRSSGRYQNISSRLGIVYTSGGLVSAADPTIFARASYSTVEKLNNWTFDNQLTGHFKTGTLTHNVLIGVDRQVAHSRELYAFGSATSIDPYNPVYGSMPTPHRPGEVPDPFGGLTEVHSRQQGVYAQDQIAAGGLRVTLSGRQDWARAESFGTVQRDSKFTWRAGALYLLPFGLAPYVSYSTSFEPQTTPLADGSLPKPSLGKQIEAGAKYQMPGTDILITAAWFNIEQTNVAVPDNFFSYHQTGKVRSRGIEVEGTVPLPYGFNAKVAFSRQHQKVLEDIVAAHVGHPIAGVGRGGITANLDWSPKSGPAEGLTVGGAVRRVDRVYADIGSDGLIGSAVDYRHTPSYTLFDALLRYDLGKLSRSLTNVQIGLNATNIFDKKYLTSCLAQYSWCWYGQRRTVQGTIGVHW